MPPVHAIREVKFTPALRRICGINPGLSPWWGVGGWPSKAEAVGQWYISVCVYEALCPFQHYGNKTKLPRFLIRGSSFTFHQGVKIKA